MSPSPTPSPPPAQPTTSSPGPRSLALQKVFQQALTATLKSNSYANFSQCFPTPAAHCPGALEGVWKQLNAKLEEGCTKEFEAIVRERKVVEGLNGWDGVIEEARKRSARAVQGQEPPRPAHTLSMEDLHAAYLTPYLQQATRVLERRLAGSQKQNEDSIAKIQAQRAEIGRMMGGLEGMIADLESSIQVMRSGDGGAGNGVEKLKDEAWEMENELKTAPAK